MATQHILNTVRRLKRDLAHYHAFVHPLPSQHLLIIGEIDSCSQGKVKKSDCVSVLKATGVFKDLSPEEVAVILKAYARYTPPEDYDVDYRQFLDDLQSG